MRRYTHGPHSLAGTKGLGSDATTKAPPGEGDAHPRSRSLASRTRSCCPVGSNRPPESHGIPLVCPSFFPFKITHVFGCVGSQRWPAGSSLYQAGSFAAEHRPPSHGGAQSWPTGSSVPGRQHLQHAGSHLDRVQPRCSEARGIPATQPRIEPASPALQGRFSTAGPPGRSPSCISS